MINKLAKYTICLFIYLFFSPKLSIHNALIEVQILAEAQVQIQAETFRWKQISYAYNSGIKHAFLRHKYRSHNALQPP